jgi:hypothetical protein
VESTASLVSTIGTLQQCLVALESQGPPKLPPFALYSNDAPFAENYGVIVRCRCCAVPPLFPSTRASGSLVVAVDYKRLEPAFPLVLGNRLEHQLHVSASLCN